MKRWYAQLAVFITIGLLLAGVTFDVIQGMRDVAHSEIMGWLSISGAGVGVGAGMALLLAFVFGADAIWLLGLIIWAARKKLRISDKDSSTYLP